MQKTALQILLLAVAGRATTASVKPVAIEMRNVRFRVEADVILMISALQGRLVPTAGTRPVTFDDRNSFFIDIDSADVAISAASLAHLLNSFVFAYRGAPLKNMSLKTDGERLILKGTVHKGLDLPFEVEGEPSVTANGNIRLHADTFKAGHVPVKGLLNTFGEDLSKLINLNEARGVRIQGDDIIMFPDKMMPPPHIRGRLTSIRVSSDELIEQFRGPRHISALKAPEPARNFIYHSGGTLRFGKLTMTDADLEIIDETPNTPFDFFLAEYNRQLVAGYSKNTPTHGLIVYMPDYAEVVRHHTTQNRDSRDPSTPKTPSRPNSMAVKGTHNGFGIPR